MITVDGLTKRFGDKVAVDDLSFELSPGKVYGFLGPNGAGKSTTMRMMLSIDRPNAGRVTIDDGKYEDLQYPARVVGAVLDASAVHPARTARNHLRALAAAARIPDSRVDEMLEVVGLSAVARKKIGGFSLGMHQRLGLAMALLGDPQYLLLDEPTNGLDPEGIRWARQLLQHAAGQGKCVFVSSHLLSELAQFADELVVIGQGRLITRSTLAEFTSGSQRTWVRVKSPAHQQLASLLVAAGGEVETEADGSLQVRSLEAAQVGDIAGAAGITLHELAPASDSLEDAFLEATESAQEFRTGAAPSPEPTPPSAPSTTAGPPPEVAAPPTPAPPAQTTGPAPPPPPPPPEGGS